MFLLAKPSRPEIERFVAAQSASQFSYSDVGASNEAKLPVGFDVDHNRIRIGTGEPAWRKAVEAVNAWRMFEMPWCELYWPAVPIQPGTNVGILLFHLGFYSLNASRIIYTIHEKGDVARFGFAYGTLSHHAEIGEERFSVEWHKQDDSVWYDLFAFSRPRVLAARIGYPITRMLQRRFVKYSKQAMLRAVAP